MSESDPRFQPLLKMASGVCLTLVGNFVFGTPGFPLSDVPSQQIVGGWSEEIHESHSVT